LYRTVFRIPPLCGCGMRSTTAFIPNRLKTDSASKKKERPQGIVVKQEVQKRRQVDYGVDWQGLKNTWVHLTENVKAMLNHDKRRGGMKDRMNKEDFVMYYFRNEDDLDHWYVNTDEDVGGRSWAEFRQGLNGMTAVFRGYLNNAPPKSKLPSVDPLKKRPVYRGFVYLETVPFRSVLNKEEYMSFYGFNLFKLRIRGDGRKYMFEAMCDVGNQTQFMYVAPLYTNGGPLWQEVTIPFSKMIMMHNDVATHLQENMALEKMANFRFSLNDGMDGPFQLEIDYIALERDTTAWDGTDYYDPWTNVNTKSH